MRGIQGIVEESQRAGARTERTDKEFMEDHGFAVVVAVEGVSRTLNVVYVCRYPNHIFYAMLIQESHQIY